MAFNREASVVGGVFAVENASPAKHGKTLFHNSGSES